MNKIKIKNYDLEDFYKLHHIELHYASAKNSNSNSPVERFHLDVLRKKMIN